MSQKLAKKKILTPGAMAYLGKALSMNTEFGQVILVCNDDEAVQHVFDIIKDDESQELNKDAVYEVAVIQQKDVTETRS